MTNRMLGRMLVGVAGLIGCQTEPPPPVTPVPAPASGSARVAPSDAAAPGPVAKAAPPIAIDAAPPIDAEEVDDPNAMDPLDYASRQAFQHHFPQLPMISADGKHVAIDRSYTHGMGYWKTFKYGWYGPDGKLEQEIDVIDEQTADAIESGKSAPTAAALAAKAALVWKKLDGYVALAPVALDDDLAHPEQNRSSTKLGTTTLVVEQTFDGVAATWTDAHGKKLRATKVDHSDGSGPHSCNGMPKLDGSWFDAPHLRVVLAVRFMGRDSCEDDPPEWRVF